MTTWGTMKRRCRTFEDGNRIRSQGNRPRRATRSSVRIDQLIEATPPGYRDRQPDPGVDDPTPILLVGMPRSGSTVTEQIVSSHPEVAAGRRTRVLGLRVRSPREDHVEHRLDSAEATQRLADDYLATLRSFGARREAGHRQDAPQFLAARLHSPRLPQRHASSIAGAIRSTARLSMFTTNFYNELRLSSQNRGDLVFYTRQYQRLMAHWRNVLPPDRFVEVDYEALVADPAPHARRLVAACGLEWNDACLAPHLNTRKIETASLWQAREPIYRTSVERWRRYGPWLGELRELAPEA